MEGRAKEVFFLLLLIAIPFFSYLNSLDGAFVFDDSRIYTSPSLRIETLSVKEIVHAVKEMEPATRPVANLTFVLNYLVHGFTTRGYHVVNLCIHIATGLLLYFFLRTTLAQPGLLVRPGEARWTAFASSLIWLVHPLQTQAVSYIVQRMTSLSALCYLLSLSLYALGRNKESAAGKVFLFAGSLFAGVLALGSKENAVTLPLFVLLYEWFFLQNLRTGWLAVNKKYLVVVCCFLIAVSFLFLGDNPWDRLVQGYENRNYTPAQRMFTELRVVIYYLGLLAFPHPDRLSSEHDFVLSTSLVTPLTTFPAAVAILLILLLAVIFAARFRFESFCIFWFFGNHLVEGTVVPLELVFEHRNYLPSMLALPFAVICIRRLGANNVILSLLFAVIIAIFSHWTQQRNLVWQNEFSLWRDAVSKAPKSARAHNNLAVELEAAGEVDEAILHFQETLRLDPGYMAAHYNLAGILLRLGDITQAVSHYQQAVLLRPDESDLRISLANALLVQGRFEEAKTHYLQAIRLDPGNAEARMKLRAIQWKRTQREPSQGRQGEQ